MKRKHWCILIVYKSDLLALQVLLSDLLEEFINPFASQRRSLMVQTIVLLNGLERPLLLGNLAFLLQILLIPYQTPEVQDLYNKLLADGFTVSDRLENGYLPIIVLKTTWR